MAGRLGQLRQVIPDILAKWEPTLAVSVARWTIRRMNTKWGSCNRETGHIWFNIELAKSHPRVGRAAHRRATHG